MRNQPVLIVASTLLISLFAPAVQAVNAVLSLDIEMDRSLLPYTKEFHATLDVTEGAKSSKDYTFTTGKIIEDNTTAVAWYSANFSNYKWTLSRIDSWFQIHGFSALQATRH